jgi:hypothetical protein
MTGPKPMACVVGKCASVFAYREECAIVVSGCCARDMLTSARQLTDGVQFPMDLTQGGNPFVNALELHGLVRIRGNTTIARGPA